MGPFEGHRLIVVGVSSGMGRQTAEDVIAHGGSAVIIGRSQAKLDDTVNELSHTGQARCITTDLANRDAVRQLQGKLAAEHSDTSLLVNAAGFFIPKPFHDYTGG